MSINFRICGFVSEKCRNCKTDCGLPDPRHPAHPRKQCKEHKPEPQISNQNVIASHIISSPYHPNLSSSLHLRFHTLSSNGLLLTLNSNKNMNAPQPAASSTGTLLQKRPWSQPSPHSNGEAPRPLLFEKLSNSGSPLSHLGSQHSDGIGRPLAV